MARVRPDCLNKHIQDSRIISGLAETKASISFLEVSRYGYATVSLDAGRPEIVADSDVGERNRSELVTRSD